MVDFALNLFTLGLKRSRFDMNDSEATGLNIFVEKWSCALLKTNSESTRLATLKCLGYLLKLPLPAWTDKLMDVANVAFKLLEKTASTMGEVIFRYFLSCSVGCFSPR